MIELDNEDWCAFEIKLGANQINIAANNLLDITKSFNEDLEGKPPTALCVICGLTNAAYLRPDEVYVVPITALRPQNLIVNIDIINKKSLAKCDMYLESWTHVMN